MIALVLRLWLCASMTLSPFRFEIVFSKSEAERGERVVATMLLPANFPLEADVYPYGLIFFRCFGRTLQSCIQVKPSDPIHMTRLAQTEDTIALYFRVRQDAQCKAGLIVEDQPAEIRVLACSLWLPLIVK